MGKKKNKKVDPNEGVHSCPMCEKYEPHVRMLHEDRLRGLLFANNNEQVRGMVRSFEANLPWINEQYLASKRK